MSPIYPLLIFGKRAWAAYNRQNRPFHRPIRQPQSSPQAKWPGSTDRRHSIGAAFQGVNSVEDSVAVARQQLRDQMPVSRRFAYFDHAAVGPLPAAAAQQICSYAEVARDFGDARWLEWSAGLSVLRGRLAHTLNAHEDEIALVGSTTQGLNIVAEGLAWQAGDNVVLPANEFPSNSLPWQNLQRLGVETRRVEVGTDGEISLDHLAAAIDSRTRLLAISWVGFVSGYRIDVGQVVEMAHSRGCLVCLDAIQGLGAFPLDVRATDVDFVCADGHKWMLGPEGAGMLYIRASMLEKLRPVGVGWGSLAAGSFTPGAANLKKSAGIYEGGSANMPGLLGFSASLGTLIECGAAQSDSPVAGAILDNVEALIDQLSAAGFQVTAPASRDHRSGIMSVGWDKAREGQPQAAASDDESRYNRARKHCLDRDIVLSVRGGRLRVSTHAYNDPTDIGRLVDALVEFRETT